MKAYEPKLIYVPGYWRDVVGFEGIYQVSIRGQVRKVLQNGKVRDMTPYKKCKKNALFIKLTKNGKQKEIQLLKIVAEAFYGPVPKGKVPHHKNGILTDNRADNVEYITRTELGKKTGHMADRRKPVLKVDKNGEEVEVYRSAREAARCNFMSYQSVIDRCKGRVKDPYKLNGYTFCYEQ